LKKNWHREEINRKASKRNIPISQSEPGWHLISPCLVDSTSHTGRFCFSHFVLHFLCPLRFGVGEIFSKNRNEIDDNPEQQ